MAIGLHTAAMMVFALSQFLFFRLTEKADELLDLAGLDLRGGGEFSLLMLAPLGVVAWLLFRVYRRERDRLVLESNLTSAAIETMRRDLLD